MGRQRSARTGRPAAAFLLIVALASSATTSATAYAPLPVPASDIAVGPDPDQHVYVSPAGEPRLFEFDRYGRRIKEVRVPTGPSYMYMNGSEMFVSGRLDNAIERFDVSTLEKTGSWPTSPVQGPQHLVRVGDFIWFTYCGENSGLASLNLTTGLVMDHGTVDDTNTCLGVDAFPANEEYQLITWSRYLGESRVSAFNVASGIPILVHQMTVSGGEVAARPAADSFLVVDGDVVQRVRRDDFTPLEKYKVPGRVVALDESDDGTIAVGVDRDGFARNLFLFRPNAAAPHFTAHAPLGENGVALAPQGERVFTASQPFLATMLVPRQVRATDAFEYTPSSNGEYLAWTQSPAYSSRKRYVYYKQPHGAITRIREPSWVGEVDGRRLVYQAVVPGQAADIRIRDMSTHRERTLRAPINTRNWEYLPSLDGGRLLFARLDSRGLRTAHLVSVRTGRGVRLDATRGNRHRLNPGQLSGGYATWEKCNPRCNIYLYSTKTGRTVRVPNPRRETSFGPSVSPSGVVYFGRGGPPCGDEIRLMRYEDGKVSTLSDLSRGTDFFTTSVYLDGQRRTHVVYDEYRCGEKQGDIREVVDS